MKLFTKTSVLSRLIPLLALFFVLVPTLQAQTQITRSIRLIVPYAPGGATDALTRLIAPYIGDEFGQQAVVENRPGAGSTIGTLAIAKAEPDGLTIGMIDAAFITNPSLLSKLPYDTQKDFTPIVFIATSPLILVVNPALAANTVPELIAYAKVNVDKVTFGSAGQGTGAHLAAEQFRSQAAIQMLNVPFKGAGEAITQLIGGQITAIFSTQTGTKAMLDAGRVKALAITSKARSDLFPNVPTFTEAGLPHVDASTINGLIAPAGTPADYVNRVNATVNKALKDPSLQAKLMQQGFVTVGGTPSDFATWIPAEIVKWAKIIKEANIKVE
ncbi:MAG: tripartite tricarboxylate transporter substrate binding protein [Alcaligenaceae bacterium]